MGIQFTSVTNSYRKTNFTNEMQLNIFLKYFLLYLNQVSNSLGGSFIADQCPHPSVFHIILL